MEDAFPDAEIEHHCIHNYYVKMIQKIRPFQADFFHIGFHGKFVFLRNNLIHS